MTERAVDNMDIGFYKLSLAKNAPDVGDHDQTIFPTILATPRSIAKRSFVEGIGVNDAPYMVDPTIDGKRLHCPFYIVWRSMLKRCYSPIYHAANPTYKNCMIVDEWRSFMAFRSWVVATDWRGKQLDKDILYPGNKIYSPMRCTFVDHTLNQLLPASDATRGQYPLGVSVDKRDGRFQARIRTYGKPRFLGRFNTPEEAQAAWVKAKVGQILSISIQEQEPISSGLHRHAKAFFDGSHPLLLSGGMP